MNDCNYCPVEKECYYPHKPCDCVLQRKFLGKEQAFEDWFKKLKNWSMYEYGFSFEAVNSFNKELYREYFNEGLSPQDAIKEDLTNL